MHPRTVILMLDETIVTETPPLYSCYGRIGEQVRVPISGNRAKRILHGVLNVWSGDVLLLITDAWVQETHQYFLRMIRTHWRGWNIRGRIAPRGARPSTGPEKRSAPRAGQRLGGAVARRWRPPARSLRDRNRL